MAVLRATTGRFIVLEGPDGSGTTTHAALLAKALQQDGDEVVTTAEPTDGPIGSTVRAMLREGKDLPADALQLLFIADRAAHVAACIAPSIARGATVICDRYSPSTIAYGSALGLDAAWLEELNTKFVQPDILLLLLPPVEVCLERLRQRSATDMLEREDVQRKVHAAYMTYATSHSSVHVIDSSGAPGVVASHILAAVRAAG